MYYIIQCTWYNAGWKNCTPCHLKSQYPRPEWILNQCRCAFIDRGFWSMLLFFLNCQPWLFLPSLFFVKHATLRVSSNLQTTPLKWLIRVFHDIWFAVIMYSFIIYRELKIIPCDRNGSLMFLICCDIAQIYNRSLSWLSRWVLIVIIKLVI